MKALLLKNTSYCHIEKGFKEWLDILGYNEQTVYNMPHLVREFLHWLEQEGIQEIKQVNQQHYQNYFSYLSSRANQRRSGALSNNFLNKHLQALEKLSEYLNHRGAGLPAPSLKHIKQEKSNINVLSQAEIQQLFEACAQESDYPKQAAFNARDKVLLSVFYGCGLRRREGGSLHIEDLNFDRRIVHVRKGKNYKERFVPFSKTSSKYLQTWIYDQRPQLLNGNTCSALFIGRTGKPMSSNTLYHRLKQLQVKTDNPLLQQKDIGLHTLRHSIATHLLENGMKLEQIQRFLGHSSLESTEIYTHLIEKGNGQ